MRGMRGPCLLILVVLVAGCGRRPGPAAPPPLPDPPRVEATWIRNGERLTAAVGMAEGGGTASARLGRRSIVLTVTRTAGSPPDVEIEAVRTEEGTPRGSTLTRRGLPEAPAPLGGTFGITPPTDPSYPWIGAPNQAALDLRGGQLRRELIAAGAVIDELELHWVPR